MRERYAPALLLTALILTLAAAPALASSHREAPGIAETPKVDGTDFYMFRSYEPGRDDYVTLIANYVPLQDAYGGPNFFSLDPDAVYRIHIDNTGDGVEDVTFQFRVAQFLRDIKIPVGGQQISVPLLNVGQIAEIPGFRSPSLNVLESYTVQVIRGPVDEPTSAAFAISPLGSERFGKPVDNIGQKSIPDYESYADGFIQNITIPGCSGNNVGRVFVGQRKESFAVNLGEVFDLVNIADPLGPRDAEPNILEDKNITSFILEAPIRCLTRNEGSPVIGGWTTAALRQNRVLKNNPTFQSPNTDTGGFVQVSRLGMPLVNEVVIGLRDKNLFNAANPKGDAALAAYVTNPTLPELLEILFGVGAPNNFPRTDLVAAFATGIDGLNLLSDGAPHEMQRLNTSIAPTPAAAQNNLGVLGGDNAGFPNGRRPGDDVVDIELRVAMGVLCHAFPGVFCNPADAPAGNLPFTDGTLQDASQFDSTFPYLRTPLPGSPNGANGEPAGS